MFLTVTMSGTALITRGGIWLFPGLPVCIWSDKVCYKGCPGWRPKCWGIIEKTRCFWRDWRLCGTDCVPDFVSFLLFPMRRRRRAELLYINGGERKLETEQIEMMREILDSLIFQNASFTSQRNTPSQTEIIQWQLLSGRSYRAKSCLEIDSVIWISIWM